MTRIACLPNLHDQGAERKPLDHVRRFGRMTSEKGSATNFSVALEHSL